MSGVKRDKLVEDILNDLRKDVSRLQVSRKVTDDVKLNYIIGISEAHTYTDSIATNPNKRSINETYTYTDSVTGTKIERFELEVVDGLHANEAVVKINFWELLS